MGHFMRDDGVPEFAKAELLDKNRKTFGYYRAMTPVIQTVDVDLIKSCFQTHFSAFPDRNPGKDQIEPNQNIFVCKKDDVIFLTELTKKCG